MVTNALENVNLKLKKLVGSGFLSEKNAYRKVKEFHEDQIALYTQCVVCNQMNKVKLKYLNREKGLIECLEKFEDQSLEDKILSLEYHCIELGCYTSELDAADFGKIPNPELEEIQEIESASFLSFREVLCYE